MALTYTDQPISHLIEGELWPLLVQHREELTTNKALMKLNPDVACYRAMEEAGTCFSIVVRDGEQIVGYSINIIAPHLHYRDVLMVYTDALWTTHEHRSRIGVPLMDATRAASRARGAHLLAWHAKPDTPLDRVMRIQVRRGRARVQDTVYTEEL